MVDAISPTGSVTLAPGGSGSITINFSVTGNQAGTATFQVDRNWTLAGGTFSGSNPQTFTVPPRASSDAATTFQTTGTVTVDSSQADGGPFTLHVAAFNITNDNQQGAKLGAGATASYNVTVQTPAPTDTTAPTVNVSTHNSVPTSGWFAGSPQQVDVSAYDASGVTNIQCSVDGGSFSNASSQAGAGTSAASPRTGSVSVAGDGSHVVVCRATDGATPANTGAAAGSTDTVTANIDTTGPTVNCTVPDQTVWYPSDVSVPCTATDNGSDLATSGDANFTLSTNVSAGSETTAAQTSSRTVFDKAGNSTTVGPYTFKVDEKAPVISDNGTSQSPTGNDGTNDWYNHDVTVNFSAADGGSGVACTTPWTKTTSGEGSNVSVSSGPCADNLGNNNAGITSSGYHIDETNPSVNCTVPDQTIWYGANQSVTCTASDNGSHLADSADASFTLSTNVAAGDETDSGQTSSKTVYDNAGNSSTVGPYTFKVDRKAPQQSSCDTADGNWHASDVTLHCTYTDGGSGPASQQIALTTNVAGGTETNNATASAGGTQACDAVGNCAASPTDIGGNKIDKKAPVISDNGTSQSPTGNDGTNDWYNHDVTVNFSAADGGSGVACTTPWTKTTSGEGSNVSVSSGPCADNVGNNNAGITSSGYHIDETNPSVNCTVPDQTIWYGHNVTISCTASDGGSHLADSADANFMLSTSVSAGDESASAQTASKTVYDNAGNSSTVGPYTFKVDLEAPQQSSCDTADGNWHASDVTLHCTYTDGGSGPASQQIALTTNVAGGTETNNATASAGGTQACDAVGNCAASPTDIGGNKIDKKAPVISDNGTSQSPTGNDGTNDWYNHDVTVNFSAADGGSGVACTTPWTRTTSGEGGNVSVSSGSCADNVGNNNAGITSSGYHIDKTNPAVSVTGVVNGATYTLGSVPTAGCSTSDGLSGVRTQATLSTSGGPVGSITATCSGAQDSAGNTGSASVTYYVHYNFTGFFQPVDNQPTCNSVKAGQAVPVKFSLNGYQGLNIFASGSPSVAIGTCAGVPIDAVETTVTAGNSSLSYDPISDQYTYVWKTDKAWAGKAMRLSIDFADGTTQYARFSFTK